MFTLPIEGPKVKIDEGSQLGLNFQSDAINLGAIVENGSESRDFTVEITRSPDSPEVSLVVNNENLLAVANHTFSSTDVLFIKPARDYFNVAPDFRSPTDLLGKQIIANCSKSRDPDGVCPVRFAYRLHKGLFTSNEVVVDVYILQLTTVTQR